MSTRSESCVPLLPKCKIEGRKKKYRWQAPVSAATQQFSPSTHCPVLLSEVKKRTKFRSLANYMKSGQNHSDGIVLHDCKYNGGQANDRDTTKPKNPCHSSPTFKQQHAEGKNKWVCGALNPVDWNRRMSKEKQKTLEEIKEIRLVVFQGRSFKVTQSLELQNFSKMNFLSTWDIWWSVNVKKSDFTHKRVRVIYLSIFLSITQTLEMKIKLWKGQKIKKLARVDRTLKQAALMTSKLHGNKVGRLKHTWQQRFPGGIHNLAKIKQSQNQILIQPRFFPLLSIRIFLKIKPIHNYLWHQRKES